MSDAPYGWPGIRAKLWPITVVRVPVWGLSVTGPLEYYGAWMTWHVGPWLLFFGRMEARNA